MFFKTSILISLVSTAAAQTPVPTPDTWPESTGSTAQPPPYTGPASFSDAPSDSTDQPTQLECYICELIIAQARNYFDNKVTNEQVSQRQLINECKRLPRQAKNTCKNIVNNNIDKIFSDIKAGLRNSQICYDIGACAKAQYSTTANLGSYFLEIKLSYESQLK